MESESQAPNYNLIGKKLTERSSTDIFGKLFGHEMRISSPVWLPEAWKNKIVDEMRGKFQRAFPGIDFSRVASKELNSIGLQTIFAESTEEAMEKHEPSGIAFVESMTQIVATYTYLRDKGKSVTLEDLEQSGFAYFGSKNIDRITKTLVRNISQYHARHANELPPFNGSKTDQFTHETAQTVARALFTGNFDELGKIFTDHPRGKSLDELLYLPIRDQVDAHSRQNLAATEPLRKGSEITLNALGVYTEDTSSRQTAIVYNAAGSARASIMRPLVDLLARMTPKDTKIQFPHHQDWQNGRVAWQALSMFIRTINLHEFTHFFSFRLWRKQPPDTIDPSIRSFLTESS